MPDNDNMRELPEKIPESWLTQLKEALRPDARKALIWTVLGSSVVAAVFTAGSNLYLESYKAKNAANVEQYKACLEIKKESLREKRALYSTLAEKYRQLEVDFDNCIGTCTAAIGRPTDPKMQRFAYDSLDAVTQRLVEVQTAARSPQIDQELRKRLATLNDMLGPMLFEVSDDGKKVPHLDKLPDFVKSCKDKVRPQVDEMDNQIQLAMRSLKIEPCN